MSYIGKQPDVVAVPGNSSITNAQVAGNAAIEATKLSFTQSGTGAVARTVESKLKDVVSVKDFGVVGDGTANDSAAFALAIAAAAGKILVIPTGTVIGIGTLLTWSTADVTLVGYGATIKQLAAFPVGGSYPKVIDLAAANVKIEGVKFESANSKTADAIFSSNGTGSGFKLINCSFDGFKAALWMYDASNVLVDGVSTVNCASYHLWFQHNVATTSNTNIKVRNCRLDNTSANPATANNLCLLVRGVTAYPVKDVEVTSCSFLMPDQPTNSTVLGCELRHVKGATFSSCYGEGGSMLVSLAGCVNTVVDSNTGIRQNFYSIEVPGTSTLQSDNVVISNNTVDGQDIANTGVGLQGNYTGRRISITGNTISGIKDRGIYADANWQEMIISGNTISCTSANGPYGIFLNGTVGKTVITGNYFRGGGAGTKAIAIFAAVTPTQGAIITGNLIENWTENALFLYANTGQTLDGVNFSSNVLINSASGNPFTTSGPGTFGNNIQGFGNTTYNNLPLMSAVINGSWLDLANRVADGYGTADPENSLAAATGSIYRRRGGGYDNTLYIKNTGTANTGWCRTITKDANGVTYVADNITKGASTITPAGTTSTCTVNLPASSSWRTASVTVKATTTENAGSNPGAAEKVVNVKYLNATTSLQVTNTDIVTSAGLSLAVTYGTRNMTVTATSGASGAPIFWSIEVAAPTGQSTLTFA